jgi:hypothetical protein
MQIKSESVTATVEQQLAYRELAPGLFAFKMTRRFVLPERVPAGLAGFLKDVVTCGLARAAELQAFVSGDRDTLVGDRQLCLMPPDFLKKVQLQGYFLLDEEAKGFTAQMDEVNSAPLEMPEDWVVVRQDHAGHMLFDLDENPLPVGLAFDYTGGCIRDGCYDMDKLVAHLNENPQVTALRSDMGAKSKPARITVESVPYYNISPGCTKYASFLFAPTSEQMQQLWETAKRLNKKYPSTVLREAVFELDMLGLRAAGIARSDSYYGVNTPEPEENDDA